MYVFSPLNSKEYYSSIVEDFFCFLMDFVLLQMNQVFILITITNFAHLYPYLVSSEVIWRLSFLALFQITWLKQRDGDLGTGKTPLQLV